MSCTFRTNIDCMKRFMGNISGLSIEPSVGDLIRVYKDSELEVDLQVVGRRWTFTNGSPISFLTSDPQLTCELHLPSGDGFGELLPSKQWESLSHFIKVMGEHGIRE